MRLAYVVQITCRLQMICMLGTKPSKYKLHTTVGISFVLYHRICVHLGTSISTRVPHIDSMRLYVSRRAFIPTGSACWRAPSHTGLASLVQELVSDEISTPRLLRGDDEGGSHERFGVLLRSG